ncbi:hypothetical protein UFOVP1290_151 [uncultured Caudovirales phage]|uniref:Uncharacterized protein n=1 Tax=uncultured Caudovirales phage TaxID=2100421 RepID=A0A6J5RSR5_9CAUD|nr:hypothetical protein UFOVP1290_151 [uncultured Caudovirales phage]
MLDELIRGKIRDVFTDQRQNTMNDFFIVIEVISALKVEREHTEEARQYLMAWIRSEVANAGILVYGSRGGVKLRTSKDGATPFENGATKGYEKK